VDSNHWRHKPPDLQDDDPNRKDLQTFSDDLAAQPILYQFDRSSWAIKLVRIQHGKEVLRTDPRPTHAHRRRDAGDAVQEQRPRTQRPVAFASASATRAEPPPRI
jgi:hypothetical protein